MSDPQPAKDPIILPTGYKPVAQQREDLERIYNNTNKAYQEVDAQAKKIKEETGNPITNGQLTDWVKAVAEQKDNDDKGRSQG